MADQRRTDTRERVLSVALELFARQGYQATSLREISERLGVTKAAVYFHFRTKPEILTALLRDYADSIAALAADAEAGHDQEDVLRRYAALQQKWGLGLVLLLQQNYREIRDLPIRDEVRSVTDSLVRALAPAGDHLRARLALTTFQVAATNEEADDDAALALALEVLRGVRPG
ncbi:TetR/AcrR family transcriptional regulator [Actinoplanes bogorensis]|uniref:TetR/AcrR family transcriptional regulator n=1 Tax=Paractinoplanes bogorensis TaxID=1610840 RepID=A0ABS5YWI3_9ACTN|nr:helix-turn-helix domain-containing protein [Actinoplanes bogorensis]MBU2667069.1 TetR/AcrR family transcriptional regulator [Actinoplanes bogorensis]